MNSEHNDKLINDLVSAASDLKSEISKLNYDSVDTVTKLSVYVKKTRKMTWGLIISIILDVLLTVLLTSNTIRLDSLTERLDYAQTVNRQKALCPLYQLFLDSKSDVGRAHAPDPVKYDQAFVVIKDGYNALGCSAFIQKQP